MNSSSLDFLLSPLRTSLSGYVTAATIAVVPIGVADDEAVALEQQNTATALPVTEGTESASGAIPAYQAVRSNLLEAVFAKLAVASNAVWAQADNVVDTLQSALQRLELSGAPPIAAMLRDDGSMLLEWALPDRRLAFNIELVAAESSWTIAKANGDLACGDLMGSRLQTVVELFLGTRLGGA